MSYIPEHWKLQYRRFDVTGQDQEVNGARKLKTKIWLALQGILRPQSQIVELQHYHNRWANLTI
jgi:hypothetical protein